MSWLITGWQPRGNYGSLEVFWSKYCIWSLDSVGTFVEAPFAARWSTRAFAVVLAPQWKIHFAWLRESWQNHAEVCGNILSSGQNGGGCHSSRLQHDVHNDDSVWTIRKSPKVSFSGREVLTSPSGVSWLCFYFFLKIRLFCIFHLVFEPGGGGGGV